MRSFCDDLATQNHDCSSHVFIAMQLIITYSIQMTSKQLWSFQCSSGCVPEPLAYMVWRLVPVCYKGSAEYARRVHFCMSKLIHIIIDEG
jgi:hypothetical protein